MTKIETNRMIQIIREMIPTAIDGEEIWARVQREVPGATLEDYQREAWGEATEYYAPSNWRNRQ